MKDHKAGTRKTILIVDDSAINRDVYTMLLEHHGYRVRGATDGRDGVAKAREILPDLILMDISMPIMDGLEATALLKQHCATRNIPVVAVTAHDDQDTISSAMAVGMHGYLVKPTTPRVILSEIARCLGTSDFVHPGAGVERNGGEGGGERPAEPKASARRPIWRGGG